MWSAIPQCFEKKSTKIENSALTYNTVISKMKMSLKNITNEPVRLMNIRLAPERYAGNPSHSTIPTTIAKHKLLMTV